MEREKIADLSLCSSPLIICLPLSLSLSLRVDPRMFLLCTQQFCHELKDLKIQINLEGEGDRDYLWEVVVETPPITLLSRMLQIYMNRTSSFPPFISLQNNFAHFSVTFFFLFFLVLSFRVL